MSHYAKYLRERTDKQIFEDEYGFFSYYFLKDGIFVENVYVDSDFRKSGHARRYAKQIEQKAIDNGFNKIYLSVIPSTKGSTESLLAAIACGAKVNSCTQDYILLIKEL